MKTKTTLSTRLAHTLSSFALLAAGTGFWACTAEFEVECPEGQVQTAGGGDVNNACSPIGAGSGGSPGGVSGLGGSAPQAGNGGEGGGSLPVPPGGECNPNATKCGDDAQQTCDDKGKWGEAQTCDIACDAAGSKCVVPVQVVAGASHACARLSDGTLRCWGSDKNEELGNGPASGSVRPAPVSGLGSVVDLVISTENLGRETTCAILADKTARCWGANMNNVASAADGPIQSPAPLGVAGVQGAGIGSEYMCILTEQGAIQCRGDNRTGELGNGGTEDSATFVPTDPLPSRPTQLAAGLFFNCAVMDNGSVACWGANTSKQVGVTSQDEVLSPTLVPGVGGVKQIALSGSLACALRTDGAVQCWGTNQFGELGRGNQTDTGQSPGFVKNLGDVVSVSAGSGNVCAVKKDNTLWCWGSASTGQLGAECGQISCSEHETLGSLYVPTPTQVPLENVADVSVGGGFVCALTADAKLYCWGRNNNGQLGINQAGSNVATPTAVVWKLGLPPLPETP